MIFAIADKKNSFSSQVGWNVLIALLYFIAGKLGTLLAVPPGYATPVWAPSGIALAGVLLRGYSVWPGIWLGSCLVNYSTTFASLGSRGTETALLVLSCIGFGAALEAVIGAFLVRRSGFPNPLNYEKDVLSFLLLGGPVSCLTNATVSVSTLFIAGAVPVTNYLVNWVTWWIGDSIGVIVFTPLLLAAAAIPQKKWSKRARFVVVTLCFTFLLNVLIFIFASHWEQSQINAEFRQKAKLLFEVSRTSIHRDMTFPEVKKMIQLITGNPDTTGINIDLIDESAAASKQNPLPPIPQFTMAVQWESPELVAGRPWKLRFSQTQEYLLAHRSWAAWVVLITGLLMSGVLGAFLLVITGRNSRIEATVAERTASLEASESKWRSVTEFAQEPIITSDEAGTILSWNKAAEQLFGYHAEEMIGKSLFKIIPSLKKMSPLERLLGRPTELEAIRRVGSPLFVELSLGTWQQGALRFFSAFMRDVSERKKIDEFKTDFVAFAAHQLKTPEAEIKGYIDNMLSGFTGPLTEKQKLYLSHMQEVITQNIRLISDLLSISRIEQGTISSDIVPAELKAIVESAVRDYLEIIRRKGFMLNITEKDKGLKVLADRQKAVEAIKTVIDNAVKFTTQKIITIVLRSDNGFGVVEIQDTGPGIPDEVVPKLFSKALIFEGLRSKGGSGLGLYIAKNFMALQKGSIALVSTGPEGTSFALEFPKV